MKNKQYKYYKIIGFLLAVSIPLIIILGSMRVWEMDMNVPYSFAEDAMLGLPIIKSICENGIKGLFFCESMGAPEVSALIETPFLDFNFAFEVLGLKYFAQSPEMVYYLIYFFTFPLAGATMYLLLNRFTNKVRLSVFFSVAYAITPYHFSRGLSHMTLSNYYVVPLAIYLSLLIAEEKFCGIVPERYGKSKWKAILMYLACVVLGLGNVYYAFFGLMCMGIALIVKMIRDKKWNGLWKEAVSLYTVVFTVLLGLLPKVFYTMQNGANEMASVRAPFESELYGLKIIQLLLPCNYNRVNFLAELNTKYSSNAINVNENSAAALGIIATVGFIVACVWLIVRVIKNKVIDNVFISNRMNLLTLMILTLVLYSVSGGFGSIVSYFITPMIRCFNRSSIVIACIAVCVCVVGLNYWEENVRSKRCKVIEYVLLGFVGVFVLYSEVPVSASGWQVSAQQQDAILEEFFEQVESSLEENSMIYQLPFRQFPEAGPLVNMKDYELALGPVYTDNLRWSYGAMKGRNLASESLYIDDGMSQEFVQGIVDAGFTGVYIDTKGFDDGGEAINRFYSEILGLTPIVSEDGWLYFYVVDDGE